MATGILNDLAPSKEGKNNTPNQAATRNTHLALGLQACEATHQCKHNISEGMPRTGW